MWEEISCWRLYFESDESIAESPRKIEDEILKYVTQVEYDSIDWTNKYEIFWWNSCDIAIIQQYLKTTLWVNISITWIMWFNLHYLLKNYFNIKKNREKKYKQERYTLSENDFRKYFSWEKFGQNQWTCYLISLLDWLSNLDSYEYLIRTSIRKEWNSFFIKIPLWEPWAKEREISFEQANSRQRDYRWYLISPTENNGYRIPYSYDISLWLNALALAYWKHVIWNDFLKEWWYFDLSRLDWWWLDETIITLLWQENISIISERNIRALDEDISSAKIIESLLVNFDPKNQILSFSVIMDGKWWYLLNISDNKKRRNSSHAIIIKRFNKNEREVVFSDPWNSEEEKRMKLDDFLKIVTWYTLWVINYNAFDSSTRNSTENVYLWEENRDNWESTSERRYSKTLNTSIRNTWEVDYEKRKNRWDLVIIDWDCQFIDWSINKTCWFSEWEFNKSLTIKSYWYSTGILVESTDKQSIYKFAMLVNWREYNMNIKKWDEWRDPFLYAEKITNLIHMIRHYFIKWKSDLSENPFFIRYWALIIDNWDSDSWISKRVFWWTIIVRNLEKSFWLVWEEDLKSFLEVLKAYI